MTQTGKSVFAFLFTCLLLHFTASAQIKAIFHIGVIGVTGDTSVKLSDPVIIDYSKCFDVTNGLTRFSSPKPGVFAIACTEAPPKTELMLHAYPNPAISQLVVRSLVSYPEAGQPVFRVVLTSMSGMPIREIKTDVAAINRGLNMNVADLPMGYFTVTIYRDKERIQTFKILKAA